MKMPFFFNKNLLIPFKFVWKTLGVLFLSVLLFAPAPVLALNYNGIPVEAIEAVRVEEEFLDASPAPVLALDYNGNLQSYISNAKVELYGVLTSIKKLPNLSYENGQTTLAEIDSKLQKIKTDAGKRSQDFNNLSDEYQKEYERVLNKIKNLKMPPVLGKIGMPEEELQQRIRTQQRYLDYQEALDIQKQKLADGIVLTNRISLVSDNLEKRVNLAKQKAGNVKEYGDALNSFNDPDISREISELNQLITDVTNDLAQGS